MSLRPVSYTSWVLDSALDDETIAALPGAARRLLNPARVERMRETYRPRLHRGVIDEQHHSAVLSAPGEMVLVMNGWVSMLGQPGERLPRWLKQSWIPSVLWLLDCYQAGTVADDGVVQFPASMRRSSTWRGERQLELRLIRDEDDELQLDARYRGEYERSRLIVGRPWPGALDISGLRRFPDPPPDAGPPPAAIEAS